MSDPQTAAGHAGTPHDASGAPDAYGVYDVFNGDADGICALVQLRLADPRPSMLVSGVKREIDLLRRVQAGPGDQVNVLDVSHDVNRADVARLLAAGARVRYFDHHFAGDLPAAAGFEAHIDTAPDVCTALLVNRFLGDAHARWAVVAAFGDNLREPALALGARLGLAPEALASLETLGICINYNGYGRSVEDLHFDPAELFRTLVQWPDPLAFVAERTPGWERLHGGYLDDLQRVGAAMRLRSSDRAAALLLPDEAWCRRVSGVYANDLANEFPRRAHAIITDSGDGTLLVSVRAPRDNPVGADRLVRAFPTGGGRAAAAGINALPADQLDAFLDALDAHWA
jgi:hypothetical protein